MKKKDKMHARWVRYRFSQIVQSPSGICIVRIQHCASKQQNSYKNGVVPNFVEIFNFFGFHT